MLSEEMIRDLVNGLQLIFAKNVNIVKFFLIKLRKYIGFLNILL